MNSSNQLYQRRKSRIRHKLKSLRCNKPRICINRTNKHIYAQIIDHITGNVIVSSSSVQTDMKKDLKNGGNIAAAETIGKKLAEAAKAKKIKEVVFDRSGYLYHGRVKALADGARSAGLEF